jgi:hypothetical protein
VRRSTELPIKLMQLDDLNKGFGCIVCLNLCESKVAGFTNLGYTSSSLDFKGCKDCCDLTGYIRFYRFLGITLRFRGFFLTVCVS